MRKKVIAGNWKMHKTAAEADLFMESVVENISKDPNVEVIVCAPSLFLASLVKQAAGSDIKISGQNMHFEDSGAYTGEISAVMLKDLGVTDVIIGHSERREYFGETDTLVNKKVKAAFSHNIRPIICVGETLEEREANKTMSLVEKQIKLALEGLSDEQIATTILAYEPVWAIGTGKTASTKDANDVCAHIRSVVSELTSASVAEQVIIQYGGSVKPDNIAELLSESDIDGALVGGASLAADSFVELVKAASK